MKTVTARDLQKEGQGMCGLVSGESHCYHPSREAGRGDGWSRGKRLGGSRPADILNFLETCRGAEKAADDLHVTAQIPFEEAQDLDLLILTF